MSTPRFQLRSSIGKKLLNGITGVLLLLFIVAHLAGNLTIFVGKDALNAYAATTHSLGPLLIVIELGLAAVFLVHAGSAISVWRDNKAARDSRYVVSKSKGAASKQTVASRTMIWTGLVLLAFLIIHLKQFRFGPMTPEYMTTLPGHTGEVWDLHRIVVETFKQPIWTGVYVAVMILLGFHLRHGFWSAFQSIGALNPKLRPLAFSAGLVFALVIAIGFLLLPIFVLLSPDPASGVAMVHP
jgi:succinate dehydrogenase / fumarate reductase cytochrome b subunit